jgi:hypothetical protein
VGTPDEYDSQHLYVFVACVVRESQERSKSPEGLLKTAIANDEQLEDPDKITLKPIAIDREEDTRAKVPA